MGGEEGNAARRLTSPMPPPSPPASSILPQVRLFRRATVLIGVHGSALINSPFLARGGAVIQLVPYRLGNAGSFFAGPAQAAGLSYVEWANPRLHSAAAVHHWHFADSSSLKR